MSDKKYSDVKSKKRNNEEKTINEIKNGISHSELTKKTG